MKNIALYTCSTVAEGRLKKLKEFGRTVGVGMLRGIAAVRDPATGLRDLAIWLQFGKNKNKFVAIFLSSDNNQVITGIIKGVDKSIFKDGALRISTTDGSKEILLPLSSILTYRLFSTKEELERSIKDGLDLKAFMKGSLYFTYIGMVYISTETVLAIFEMEEFQDLKDIIEENDVEIEDELKEMAIELQNSPYSQQGLQMFVSKLGVMINIFRTTSKLELDQRITLVTLFTNFITSLLISSMKDRDMKGKDLLTT
jgi:hypothetical protein